MENCWKSSGMILTSENMRKEELIKLRSDYQPYEQAEKTLMSLVRIYKREYKPRHTPAQYFKLIQDWNVDGVELRHPQEEKAEKPEEHKSEKKEEEKPTAESLIALGFAKVEELNQKTADLQKALETITSLVNGNAEAFKAFSEVFSERVKSIDVTPSKKSVVKREEKKVTEKKDEPISVDEAFFKYVIKKK